MNSEEPYRDQAERLRRRIEQINEQTDYSEEYTDKDQDRVKEKVKDKELYPPREQLHRQKRKKTKLKLKYPVIRILVLFFILLPIIIFSVISYLDGKNGPVKTSGDSKGYEMINLDNQKNDKEDNPEVKQNQESTEQQTEDSNDKKEDLTGQKQPVTEENQKDTDTETQAPTEQGTDQSETNTNTQLEPPKDSATETNKSGIIYHKVQPQENLFRIAMKYYRSPEGMVIIQKANHLSSDQIEVGQVLKIPTKN